MATLSPKIDERNQQMLVNQLKLLLANYVSEWRGNNNLEYDKQAQALIHIFARMMEVIIQRLNRVPEKNFLSFLDMIGVQLSPPRVARAPLTFMMAAGSKQYGFIQAGTQVAVDHDDTIIFETENDVTIILPKLLKAISLEPSNDCWRDHSPAFFDNNASRAGEELFRGQELIPHCLYVGHKRFFSYREPVTVSLKIELDKELKPVDRRKWEVQWYCFQDGRRIALNPYGINNQRKPDQNVAKLFSSGTLYFPYLCNVSETTLQGIQNILQETDSVSQNWRNWKNNWIFAELKTPITRQAEEQLPQLKKVTLGIEINTPAVPAAGTISSQGLKVFGTKTKFRQLKAGDRVIVQGQIRFTVTEPGSDTELTLNEAFNPDLPDGTSFATTPRSLGTISYVEDNERGEALFRYLDCKDVDPETAVTIYQQEIKENQFIIIGAETRRITQVNRDKTFLTNSAFHRTVPPKTSFYYVPALPPILVDAAFYNNNPLDITKDFAPFGERPKMLNDTFYFGSEEVFSKKKAAVTLTVQLSEGVPVAAEAVELSWEFWNGTVWVRFDNDLDYQFNDGTNSFTNGGNITFTMPDCEPLNINGIENRWLRIRIIKGGYGSPVQYFEQTASEPHYLVEVRKTAQGLQKFTMINGEPVLLKQGELTEWIVTQETYQPPYIHRMELYYLMPSEQEVPENIIAYNNFEYQDHTATGPNHPMPFKPFIRSGDQQAALYLAYDQDIKGLPVKLFFPLVENNNGIMNSPVLASGNPPVIAWEYWNGKSWAALNGEDGTLNLTKREMVEFLIPGNIVKQFLFEAGFYWFRARLAKGVYEFPPRPWTICTNTVWGRHLATVRNEILGSSNGNPNQTFKLNGTPVLPGQQIMVREPALTEAEREMVIRDEGKDAIHEVKDQAGNVLELWVRWHEVDSFYLSQSNERHYRIDRNNGLIEFGDGERGMIPPTGKDNIKCSFYQYGGGSKGNVKPGTITKLRTTIPYIDSVTNLEEAGGGFDQETLERALIRGPQTLKHRERAVTYEDFEWLVKEASTKIAKAKCLPVTDTHLQYHPGWVTVIIVPETEDPKPYPGRELIRTVEDYLFARTSTQLVQYPSQINLTGPGYIGIGVEATVKYTSISAAKIIEGKILYRMQQFFHPLHGGVDGEGWHFGRNVYISEVYAAIESIEGVDFIVDLALKAPVQLYTWTVAMANNNTGTGYYPPSTMIKSKDSRIVMLLAEAVTLKPEVPVAQITVIGFKEGDRVNLRYKDRNISLVIKAVFHEKMGDVLEFEPVQTETVFPAGSLIETADRRIRSFTLSEISEQVETRYLKISTFEEKDVFIINNGNDDPARQKSGTIQKFSDRLEKIIIDSNYLVYSGNHVIHSETNGDDSQNGNELFLPYLIDSNTKEIHKLNQSATCRPERIYRENRRFIRTLDTQLLKDLRIDYCAYCFGRELSKD